MQQRRGWKTALYDLVGIICVALGFITLPLPLPFGLILIALGALILSVENRSIRKALQSLRVRAPKLDQALKQVQKKSPSFIQEIIKHTEPEK